MAEKAVELVLFERGPKAGKIDMVKTGLIPPTGSQKLIKSYMYPGLSLNISGKGRKSWVLQGRINGKQARLPLAEWGIGSDDLLEKYGKWRQDMIEGHNPLADARAEAENERRNIALTLTELFAEFKDVRKKKLKPGTFETYHKSIRLWSPDWWDRGIDTLTK